MVEPCNMHTIQYVELLSVQATRKLHSKNDANSKVVLNHVLFRSVINQYVKIKRIPYICLIKEYNTISWQVKSRRMRWHAWERREKYTRFWWESPSEGYHLEDQGVGGKMGTEWIFGRLACGGGWIGFDWLRTGTGGGLLLVR
jgi:hypothetical protein